MVVGEKAFQMIDSQMFVAMKREIPEPWTTVSKDKEAATSDTADLVRKTHETISLLKKLVEQNYNETSDDQLYYEENTNTSAEI